ncbi:MAG: sugar ABC transporter permease [TACK group archaeon]|nr:sugar ABC transporter permease [TACK group archaeon]
MRMGNSKVLIFSVPVLIFGFILLYLVLWNAYYSLFNWSQLSPVPKFAGLGVYAELLGSQLFQTALERTLMWALGLVLVGNAMGLALAALLYFVRNSRLRTVYLSIFVYPLAVPMAAVGLISVWLFNVKMGVNVWLAALHLPTPLWLASPQTAFPTLFLVTVWVFSGLSALFYLAAYSNVDQSIIESARVDGASAFTIFRKLLLPSAKSASIVSTALLFLFALRLFALPYVSTGLNPYTETIVVNLYFYYISTFFSSSAAVSTVVVVIAMIVIIPYAMYGLKRWISQ